MDHVAGLEASRWNLPKLLDSDRINLGVASAVEAEVVDQLLGQRSARPFGKDCDLGAEVITRLKVRLAVAIFVQAFVVGTHAGDALPVVKHFHTSKPRKKADACLFHESAHPLSELIQRDDVVPVVLKEWRNNRETPVTVLGEEVNRILPDG
jgi:hypothetical protein